MWIIMIPVLLVIIVAWMIIAWMVCNLDDSKERVKALQDLIEDRNKAIYDYIESVTIDVDGVRMIKRYDVLHIFKIVIKNFK